MHPEIARTETDAQKKGIPASQRDASYASALSSQRHIMSPRPAIQNFEYSLLICEHMRSLRATTHRRSTHATPLEIWRRSPTKIRMQRESTMISRPNAPGVQSVQFVSGLRNFPFAASFGEPAHYCSCHTPPHLKGEMCRCAVRRALVFAGVRCTSSFLHGVCAGSVRGRCKGSVVIKGRHSQRSLRRTAKETM